MGDSIAPTEVDVLGLDAAVEAEGNKNAEESAASTIASIADKISEERLERATLGISLELEVKAESISQTEQEKFEVEESRNVLTDNTFSSHKIQTIATYMNLTQNKKNHSLLIQEPTISGFLVLSLGDDDPIVVERSFEVFWTLSMYPENHSRLLGLNYFENAIYSVIKNRGVKSSVRTDAKKLWNDLQSNFFKNSISRPLSELSASNKNVAANQTGTNPNRTLMELDGKPVVKADPDLNTTISTIKRKNRGKETLLFIGNEVVQEQANRLNITQTLMLIKGIISVTYNINKNYCIIRGRRNLASEEFAHEVALLGHEVCIVRKNENHEEIKIPFELPPTEQENVEYPPYPEEQEYENIDEENAVAKHGEATGENKSFFKSATNFIKRSFYW